MDIYIYIYGYRWINIRILPWADVPGPWAGPMGQAHGPKDGGGGPGPWARSGLVPHPEW